jgi:predicted kinase
MTTITPEVIADVKANGGTPEEIELLENELDNVGKTNGDANKGVVATSKNTTPENTDLDLEKSSWDSQHKKDRKKLKEDLEARGFQENEIVRLLQNFDDEETLKFEAKLSKTGIDGISIIKIPDVVVPPKNPISTILNVEDYNDKIIGDDAVEKTSNWLNSYIGNRGFKVSAASIQDVNANWAKHAQHGKFINITAANGNKQVFDLVKQNNANSLEDITTWLDSQEISGDQKYIFNLTNQTPGEDGFYDIKLINKEDINPTFDTERQLAANGYKANPEQVEVITQLIHGGIEIAITDPESMGLSARYSSVRAGELSEDDKDEIRTAVFDRVNKMQPDAVINKEDFNKLFSMYDGIVQQINTDNNNSKNLEVSGEELDLEFKREREAEFLKSLNTNPRLKIKYGLLQDIKKKEAELENITDTNVRREKIKELDDLKAQILENAKIETPIYTHDPTFRAWGGKPPTVVIENPELSSMLFNNEYSVEAIEEAGELAEEFKGLSDLELAILAASLPATMTDAEVYEHYHDNVLKIRQHTEKEFLDKKITLNIGNLGSESMDFFRVFPQARELSSMLGGKDGKMTISIQKLYEAGFNSHKLDKWNLYGKEMSDADKGLWEDYEAFRLKSIAQEFSIKKMLRLNIDLPAIKKNISFVNSVWNGLVDATKHTVGMPAQEGDLTRRQTLNHLRDVVNEYNSYAASVGGMIEINGKNVHLKQIELSPKQLKAFDQEWNERIGETIGGFVPIAAQLAALSYATGGVLSFTGAARILANMKKSKNIWDNVVAFGARAGIEEFKMNGIMGFNQGDGLTFSIIGDATHGIANFKRFGPIAKLYQKTFKVGMVGATSLDVAKVTSDYIKHLKGDVQFQEEFEKYFGDSGENVQRWLTHAAAFTFHGLHNIRKTDLMGEAGKYSAIRDIEKQMRELYSVVEMEPGTGIFTKVFGNKKLSEKEAIDKYNALLNGKLTIDQMIKEHETLTSLDPKTNPKWKETMENRFGNASEFQAKLTKENPEYRGFDIHFSENPADFYHKTNAAQYNYKGSMFKGKKQDKPFILINPKLYKVGKVQHEALIHATVDAYFSQGGKQRKEVFIENVADKFKNIDFSVYMTEANKGTREYKLAEFIEDYYQGTGSVKSEEFLGYMVEFLSKPEIYYEKVAQSDMQSLAVDIKTMLRENFNMFTNVKAKDAMELLGVVARGLEGGKFNEKSFDAFIKLLGKPVEKGGLDILSTHTELTSEVVTPRGSKNIEITNLNNRKQEIIKEINSSPKDKRTEADNVAIENLRLELVEINKTLKDPRFTSRSPEGQAPLEFGNEVKNEKIVEQNTTIQKNLKENPYQEISKDPDPRKSGRGLSFDAIKLQVESISVTSKELFDKYYKDGAWTDKAKEKEWRDLENQKKGLNGLNSLKHDLIQNNQKGIDKIINQLYNKGAGVSKEDRVEKSDFKQAMMREFEKLVDSYQFKILKDGKWIDNPTPFMGYATPAFKLRDGNAYQYLKTKELVGTKRDFDFDTLTNEDGLGGGGTKGSPVPTETLVTVKEELVINGEKVVTGEMVKEMEASFEGVDFSTASYKTLKNPNLISFGKKTQDQVNFIGENAMLIYNSLPQNVSPITGKATGLQNSLLKYFYSKGERVEFKKTGDAAGNPVQNKIEMTKDQFLATLGITTIMKDGKLEYIIDKSSKDFRNVKTAIKNLEEQVSRIVYNQSAREYIMKNPDKFPNLAHNTTIETVIHEIASGKDQSMASKDFADKLMEDGHVGDYNEYRDLWNSYGLLGHEDFSKSYGPELAGKMGGYVRDYAAEKLEAGRVSETDPLTQGISKHIAKQEYSKGGISELSATKFKENGTSQENFMSQSNDIASEIFLADGIVLGNVRIFEGLFTSHYRTTGENNIVTNSFISGLRKNLITKPGEKESRFDPELLARLEKINFDSFKSPYASENYTAYDKIREASTLAEKVKIAEATFTNKSLKASRELYDVWNTVLEQYVHRNKDGTPTEKYVDGKLNPEWARKMDYVARLKKNNSVIGVQGERILAPEGYIFIPTGKYSKGKDNPEYKKYYTTHLTRLTKENNQRKEGSKNWLEPGELKAKAEKLALAETGDKVEHFMSSNEKGVSSLMLIENNQFHKRGKENMEDYVGIWGQTGEFNLIDKAGGEINTSGIFRFAYNIDIAKSTYSIESIKAGKPKTIYQEMVEKTGEASFKEIELEAAKQNKENIAILKENGIKVSDNPLENVVKVRELHDKNRVALSNSNKKIVFAIGGAGSGKSNVISKLKESGAIPKDAIILNPDTKMEADLKKAGLSLDRSIYEKGSPELSQWSTIQQAAIKQFKVDLENAKQQGLTIIVDATGASSNVMAQRYGEFTREGYNTSALFVNTSLEIAQSRNQSRERVLHEKIVKHNWEQVQGNIELYKEMFGENFMEINTDKLKQGDKMPDYLIDQMTKFSSINEGVFASKDIELSTEFNSMMEGNYDVKKEATYSPAKARVISDRRKWYEKSSEWFVGANADDFKGLTNYRLVNQKGKKGEVQQKFYDDNLHIPYAMGVNALNIAKNKIQTEYKSLNKQFPNIKKILDKDIPGEIFSNANAARVYLWTKNGIDMTEFGLSKKDIKKLNDAVTNNPELHAYADQLEMVSGGKGSYVKPDAFWLTQGIKHDLASITTGKGRDNYLAEFNHNVDAIFSPDNLNKLEVIHGRSYREALENSIYRMRKGSNRVFSKEDKLMNNFSDWVNGSVGVTMFLNTRSGVLQTLSATNYIDWGANNPINAARAFANQPQYWKDFAMIFNSPMMKQRRGGLQTDVNHNELAAMAKKGGAKGVIGSLLTKGFIITKTADSFAISAGGATFYRNTFNKHIKNGLSVKEAEKLTWTEFNEKTQTTQQSSDASKISQLQASGLGRLVFAFQNTPMQYTREMKKSILDLSKGRGDTKHNISKILYYGAAQNLLFGALQNALFTAAFDDDDKNFDTKTQRTLNNMFDTILRGSGLPGAVLATTKNTFMKFAEEEKKGFNADHAQTLIQAANFAPPIGIKARKLYSSMYGYQLNKSIIPHMGYSINNPAYQIAGSFTAAATNFPLDRIIQKSYNINEILSGDHQWWQNVSLAAGYRPWDVGIEDAEKLEVKGLVAEEKKIENAKKQKVKEEEKKIEKEKVNIEKQEEEKKEGKEVGCAKQTNDGRCGLPIVKGNKYCTVHQEVEQRKDGKQIQCKKVKKDKKRCGVMTANKSGFCYYHD